MKVKTTLLLLGLCMNFAYAYTDFDSLVTPESITDSFSKKDNRLCIKTKKNDMCFEDQFADGEISVEYKVLGKLPQSEIIIVNYSGNEESTDYFISLSTGHTVLELPPISLGYSQTKISKDKNNIIVVTSNSGYDGDPYLTNIDIYELFDDPNTGKWPNKFSFDFKEKEEGPHKYNILWLDDNTVKVQSLKDKQENIVVQKINSEWSIKDKSYKSWEDYNPDDNE